MIFFLKMILSKWDNVLGHRKQRGGFYLSKCVGDNKTAYIELYLEKGVHFVQKEAASN